ncbi:hypothetical protein DSO57_1037622 [Entomophthora muscae]|uniref:Uncharacterized protein n=1 Tax=Entomophthora muscae TaxID=34485 RepID=A0ACC2TLN2_9FUNG|nr:hypothetical protein DSO57_1037622 [Entomophthora muscae]
MSNNSDKSASLSDLNSGLATLRASKSSDRQSINPEQTNAVAAKQKELEDLEMLLYHSKETLKKINILSYEFKMLNDGYQSIDRLLNNWNNIFRFANITANKRSEYDDPPVFVKLDLPQKDI